MNRITLTTKKSPNYGLLDSGREEKLEKFGDFVLARPDPQALWEKRLSEGEWGKADGIFEREGQTGNWELRPGMPAQWQIAFGGLQFIIRPTSFKHTGLFPEQLSNWDWVRTLLRKSTLLRRDEHDPNSSAEAFALSVLNLFAYTGGATLAAAQAGAEVCHVDASKTAVAWARENATVSGLGNAPIRWITEDVLVFMRREIKRGKRYDAISMDPPAFGHGPKKELWKIEEHLLECMALCVELLSENPLFVLINGYAAGYSPLAFAYNLEQFQKKFGGTIEYGDLTIAETAGERVLPCGIFARWKK